MRKTGVKQLNRARQALLAASLIGCSAFLLGCPPTPPQQTAGVDVAHVTPPADQSPPDFGVPPTSSGVFTPLPASSTKLEGDNLRKAKLPLADALADCQKASLVPLVSAPADAATEPAEPPAQSVKYYLQARAKFVEGSRTDAMELLRKANQLDPKSFTILKLMGEVSFQSNQLSAGSVYLKEAYLLRPQDVEVCYFLGLYFADSERRQWPTAVAFLSAADSSAERLPRSPMEARVVFYLALALHSGGYSAAAAEEFERFLKMIEVPVASYRYDRELANLIEESWAVRLMAAEDYASVGDLEKALPLYRAASVGVANRPGDNAGKTYVMAREIIALARLKRSPDLLLKSTLALVAAAKASEPSIDFLAWVARQVGREEQTLGDLENAAAKDDTGYSALALAGVQERFGKKSAALATLDAYLQAHPGESGVLDRLVQLSLELNRPGVAFADLARALHADPDRAPEIRILLAKVAGDRPTMDQVRTLEKAVPASPPGVQGKAKYLLALLAEDADDRAASQEFLAGAVAADGTFWPARDAYVASLLANDQFAAAQKIVEEAIASKQGGAKAYQLKVESEAMQGRWSAALNLAEEAKAKYPDSAEIALQLANIHAARYERDEAANELKLIVKRFPKFEDGYKNQIELALSMRDPDTVFGTLRALLAAIPTSRYGNILAASFDARGGRTQDAEDLLRRMISENPGDPEALIALATVLRDQQKETEAIKLLTDALAAHPTPALGEGLADLLRDLNHKPEALAMTEKMYKEHPNSEGWLLLHVSELIAQEKKDDAEKLLRAAAEKFPKSSATVVRLCRYLSSIDKTTDAIAALKKFNAANGATAERLYLLGHLYNEANDDDQSTATLEKVLEINPDHTGACNDLGYFWVDKGKNLPRAEALIRKAVDNQPLNPAFVDSLGWVLYKQGKFEPAIVELRKAISLPGGLEPEVIGHLGDALYRSGKKDDATEEWRQAVRILSGANRTYQDRDKLLAQFRKQIQQAESNEKVDVAPLAPAEKSTSAGK